MVLSFPFVQLVMSCEVLFTELGLAGTLASMKNGPRWIAVAQLFALSLVLIWKYQLFPSASALDVKDVKAVSITLSGTVVADVDHSWEYPCTPLTLPSAPSQSTATVLSLLQVLTVCDVLCSEVGLLGALTSMKKGPR